MGHKQEENRRFGFQHKTQQNKHSHLQCAPLLTDDATAWLELWLTFVEYNTTCMRSVSWQDIWHLIQNLQALQRNGLLLLGKEYRFLTLALGGVDLLVADSGMSSKMAATTFTSRVLRAAPPFWARKPHATWMTWGGTSCRGTSPACRKTP